MRKKVITLLGAWALIAISAYFFASKRGGVTCFSDDASYRDVYEYYVLKITEDEEQNAHVCNEALAMMSELHFFFDAGTEIEYRFYVWKINRLR